MFLVFDIGGTHIRCAFSRDGRTFSDEPVVVDTPQSYEVAQEVFKTLCKKYEGIKRVCIAIAGEFDEKKEKLVFSPNLPGWIGKPLASFITEITGAPVVLVNDAVAAAVAEARIGAGKDYSIVAYLTVGTGLGGARIVEGNLDENHHGFEPGQQIFNPDTGETLEQRVAGSGFTRRFGKDFLSSAPPEAWRLAAQELAVGITATLAYWSPDVVVFGGSMILTPPCISIDEVRRHLSVLKPELKDIPPFVHSALGHKSGLYGALLLVQE